MNEVTPYPCPDFRFVYTCQVVYRYWSICASIVPGGVQADRFPGVREEALNFSELGSTFENLTPRPPPPPLK